MIYSLVLFRRRKLRNRRCLILTPDAGTGRWIKVPGGSGGGGGGSLRWVEGGNAPLRNFANEIETYDFGAGLAQALYTTVKVPESYVAGVPIKMRILAYNPDTSGNILLQSVATLIRKEVDEITSTTNQRTSTNSAITMSAANDNEPQEIELDLTDSGGDINAVAVSPGDLIKVKIQRATDTATSDVSLIQDATELIFTT
jgi:hypothetical protein